MSLALVINVRRRPIHGSVLDSSPLTENVPMNSRATMLPLLFVAAIVIASGCNDQRARDAELAAAKAEAARLKAEAEIAALRQQGREKILPGNGGTRGPRNKTQPRQGGPPLEEGESEPSAETELPNPPVGKQDKNPPEFIQPVRGTPVVMPAIPPEPQFPPPVFGPTVTQKEIIARLTKEYQDKRDDLRKTLDNSMVMPRRNETRKKPRRLSLNISGTSAKFTRTAWANSTPSSPTYRNHACKNRFVLIQR